MLRRTAGPRRSGESRPHRASATGSPTANQRLAQTRNHVVAEARAAAGVDRALLQQMPIGQTGSGDVAVAERRVETVLLR